MNRKYLFISIVYALFVFWVSIQPITKETTELFPYQDKVVHAFLYMIFAIIIATGMVRNENGYNPKMVIILSIIIPFIYSALLEVCQKFVPTRSFEMFDLFANLIGSVIGITLVSLTTFLIKEDISTKSSEVDIK
ncbi:MAG TPA: VanZ family protein [Candidatus Hydrogenedens sp.]|nr:VanZ family protein [Candidatus Hydrogenedens sp.]